VHLVDNAVNVNISNE